MKSIINLALIFLSSTSFADASLKADLKAAVDVANAMTRPECQQIVNDVYDKYKLWELSFERVETYQTEDSIFPGVKFKVTNYAIYGSASDEDINLKQVKVHVKKSSPSGLIGYTCELIFPGNP